MEDSNSTPLSAAPLDLSVNVTDYPVDDAGRWIQNHFDGTVHPAFNTDVDGLIYDGDKKEFALLAEDVPFNLYVKRYESASDNGC